MNAYEFIVKMKNYATSELKSVARSAGIADGRVDELNRSSNRLGNTWKNMKRLAAGAFTVAAITMFTNKVIDARAEYEKFQAVLTNAAGDEGIANSQLKMLTDFAATTPFQLNELTGSFVKLVNRGFIPTKNELTKLGDLAASQGKGFDQLSEAILDAETAEFERLKEFGIRASKAGDQISFSFKGVTKTVNNNSEAIRAALMEYGKMEGVAGSMAAISQTLGGRISNLKDQWNMFLVAVGGEGIGAMTAALELMTVGLGAISSYLPDVAQWFRLLWSYIEPLGVALWNFLDAAFGFGSAGDILSNFGNIMNGVLLVVNYFTTGLTFLLNILSPLADWIVSVAIAWGIFNSALAIFNALAAVNPITWIIIGVGLLIVLIGEIIKHTDGWGKSWKAVVNGSKYLWETFTASAETVFLKMVNNFMIGINKIKTGWYEFKNALGMGDSSKNNAILEQIAADTKRREEEIKAAEKIAHSASLKAAKEFSNFSITFDEKGIEKDWNSIKNKVSGLSSSGANPKDFLGDDETTSSEDPTKPTSDKNAGAETIVSGGTRRTEINITIQKLQDDTKIFVGSTEEGINGLGDKIQEMLLRSVNSINQMQTS